MTLSFDESNPVYDIIRQFKLLFPYESNNPIKTLSDMQRFLSFSKNIFQSPSVAKVFLYALQRGAFTAWDIQVHLDLPEATTYRVLKRLRKMKVIEKVTVISRRNRPNKSRGGPRPIIWAMLGADEKQVVEAYQRHLRALSPKYRAAERWVQVFLEDYREKDVTYETILKKLLNDKFDYPYHRKDIAMIAVDLLREKGLTVWM